MPTFANPKQMPKRVSLARMLAHLTFGFGTSIGATLLAPVAFGQSCDKCAGLSSPSCGCELPNGRQSGPKPCACVRKPSVGELILSHFDRVGDQIEAKAKRSGKGATCGCESPQGPSCGTESFQAPSCGCETPQRPSCGCEVCSPTGYSQFARVQLPPIQSALLRPNAGPSFQAGNGALADKPSNMSQPLTGKQPVAKKLDLNTAVNSADPSEPNVQRVPFENRKSPAISTNRIPVVETGPSAAPSIPNVLKPIPSEVPPAWTPKTLPPKAKHTAPIETKQPDVLVDPFKDDVSSRNKKKSMIQLTSDRQIAPNSLRLEPSEPFTAEQEESLTIDRPARLTPKQKLKPTNETSPANLQLEASGSTSNDRPQVVSSSYLHATPVPVVVRKESYQDKTTEMPNVSKIRVPAKR